MGKNKRPEFPTITFRQDQIEKLCRLFEGMNVDSFSEIEKQLYATLYQQGLVYQTNNLVVLTAFWDKRPLPRAMRVFRVRMWDFPEVEGGPDKRATYTDIICASATEAEEKVSLEYPNFENYEAWDVTLEKAHETISEGPRSKTGKGDQEGAS